MGISITVPGAWSSWADNEKQKKRFRSLTMLYVACICFACLIPKFGHADDGSSLMDLFTTSAFTGSWEVFSKFNLIGKISNFLISAFCLLGLILTVLRLILTLLYKSSETLFDNVYELKSKGKGQKFFGITTVGREVFNGNYGVGTDAIIGFGLSLLPNVKAYSDYNPEKLSYNLSPDDTITTYFLKISIPTIMTCFFFTIGFDGTLWQAYGNVVGGLSQVAKKVVEVDMAGYVNRALNAGSYYSFSFNMKNELGKLQKNIATSIYNKLLLKMENYETTTMHNVGAAVEQWTKEHFTAAKLDEHLNQANGAKKISDDNSAAKNLSYMTCINQDPALGTDTAGCFAVVTDVSYFGVSGKERMYTHVYVNKKDNADETDYFAPNKGVNATSAPSSVDKSNDLTNDSGASDDGAGDIQ
jgi:hypothetical protein